MKRIIVTVLTSVFVITLFTIAIPTIAVGEPDGDKAIFEAQIIDIPGGSDTLEEGQVTVNSDGTVKVGIEGATPEKTYSVHMIYGNPSSPFGCFLGFMTTDDYGDAVITVNGFFSSGFFATGPRFIIKDNPNASLAQFSSGFAIP